MLLAPDHTLRRNRLRSAILVLGLCLSLGTGCAARDSWQEPQAVIAALAIRPGEQIADLGAGDGYFTWYLAEAVGAEGRVYAVDVDADVIEDIESASAERGLANVQVILCEVDDALLPEAGTDLVFICNTYHHLEGRPAYFRRLRAALRPDGRIAVVDFDDESLFRRLSGHCVARDEVVHEMEAAGYEIVAEHDFLSKQIFVVFAPTGAARR